MATPQRTLPKGWPHRNELEWKEYLDDLRLEAEEATADLDREMDAGPGHQFAREYAALKVALYQTAATHFAGLTKQENPRDQTPPLQ